MAAGALSLDCPNQKAASDPSHFRRVAPSPLKQPLCQHWDKAIRRALGPHQRGAGSAANAQLALESLRAVARHEDTAEMCPTGIANAFGTLHRERERESLEHWKLTHISCCPTLQLRGTKRDLFFGREDPIGWHQHATRRGVPQGSPIPAILCLPLRLESLSVKDYTNTKHRIWPTLMTSRCGKESLAGPSKSFDSLTTALSKAGLEMKPSECTLLGDRTTLQTVFL